VAPFHYSVALGLPVPELSQKAQLLPALSELAVAEQLSPQPVGSFADLAYPQN
jgi:hypothetical protein